MFGFKLTSVLLLLSLAASSLAAPVALPVRPFPLLYIRVLNYDHRTSKTKTGVVNRPPLGTSTKTSEQVMQAADRESPACLSCSVLITAPDLVRTPLPFGWAVLHRFIPSAALVVSISWFNSRCGNPSSNRLKCPDSPHLSPLQLYISTTDHLVQ